MIVRRNQQQRTFVTKHDYYAYLERIAKYRQRYDVTLYAYCLMPTGANGPGTVIEIYARGAAILYAVLQPHPQ